MEIESIILSVVLVFLVLSFVAYIISSLGLMRVARKEGVANPWLAWIPFGNYWIMGEIVTDKFKGSGGLKFLGINLLYFIFSMIPSTSVILVSGIIYLFIYIVVTYWLFSRYSQKAGVHTIFSTFVPLYFPIVIYVISRSVTKEEHTNVA